MRQREGSERSKFPSTALCDKLTPQTRCFAHRSAPKYDVVWGRQVEREPSTQEVQQEGDKPTYVAYRDFAYNIAMRSPFAEGTRGRDPIVAR